MPKDDVTKPLKQKIDTLQKENDKLKGKQLEKATKDDDAFEGYGDAIYKHLQTGEMFRLRVVEAHTVRGNKTHHAKNATKFGDYTAEEFRRLFDKQ